MPYIAVHTAQSLSAEARTALEQGMGRLITQIPGKTEALLMLAFHEGLHMCRDGIPRDDLVFVDVRCFRQAGYAVNRAFVEALSEHFRTVLNLAPDALYLTISEYDTWGTQLSLKRVEPTDG